MTRIYSRFGSKTVFAAAVLLWLFPVALQAAGGFGTRFMAEVEQLKELERRAQGSGEGAQSCTCASAELVEQLLNLEDQRARIDKELSRLHQRAQQHWKDVFTQVARQGQKEPSLLQVGGKSLTAILLAAAFDAADNAAGQALQMRAYSGAGRAAGATAAKALEHGAGKMAERAAGKSAKKVAGKLVEKSGGHSVAIADTLRKLAGDEAAAMVIGRHPQLTALDAVYRRMSFWNGLAQRNRAVQQALWSTVGRGACRSCARAVQSTRPVLKGESSSRAFDAWHYANQLLMDESILVPADYHGREEAYRCAVLQELRKLTRLREAAEDGMAEAARGMALHRRTILELHALAERQFGHQPRYLEKKLGWWGYTLATFAVSISVPTAGGTAVAVGEAISDIGDLLLKKGVSGELRQRIRTVQVFISDLTALQEDWTKALRTIPRAERKVAARLAQFDKDKPCPSAEKAPRATLAGCWVQIEWDRPNAERFVDGFPFDEWYLYDDEVKSGTVLEIRPGAGNGLEMTIRSSGSGKEPHWEGYYDPVLNIADFYATDPVPYLSVGIGREERHARSLAQQGADVIRRLALRAGTEKHGTLDVLAGVFALWNNQGMVIDGVLQGVGFGGLDMSWPIYLRIPPAQLSRFEVVDAAGGKPLKEIREGVPFRLRAVAPTSPCPSGWGPTLARVRLVSKRSPDFYEDLDRERMPPVYALLRPTKDDPAVFLSDPVVLEVDLPWAEPSVLALLEYIEIGKDREDRGVRSREWPFRWKERAAPVLGPGMLPILPPPPPQQAMPVVADSRMQRILRMLEANAVHPGRFLRVMDKQYVGFLGHWRKTIRSYEQTIIPWHREVVDQDCSQWAGKLMSPEQCETSRMDLERARRVHSILVQGLGAVSARLQALPDNLLELAFAPPGEATEYWRRKFTADLALVQDWIERLRRVDESEAERLAGDLAELRKGMTFFTGLSLE